MTVSNWKMIDAVMYGMMPSAKTVSRRRLPPVNRSSQAERGAGVLIEELRQRIGVDARRGDERAQAIDGQHAKREEDTLAQVGDAEDVGEFLEHRYENLAAERVNAGS